ncbi:MAG: RraA family protein [Rhodospirillales bacterium]
MRTTAFLFFAAALALGQQQQGARQAPPFSMHLLEVKQYSQAENEAIVAKFKNLRTTDVYDALQAVGLHKVTVMDREIGPMWTNNEDFSHVIYGVAVTLRLVPPQEMGPQLNFTSNAEMEKWQRTWSQRHLRGNYAAFLGPDTVLVIDAPISADNGWCGSNNALSWKVRGMRGIVTNAGCRDSDEIEKAKIPVYQRDSTRFINEGTIAVESYNTPVVVGGVLVMPGDVIVADKDGVAVVPRAKAEAVAKIAHEIRSGDNATRRRLYQKAGMQEDFTVK